MSSQTYKAVTSLILLASLWSQLVVFPFVYADEVPVDTPQSTTAPEEPASPSVTSESGGESSESATNTQTHEEQSSSSSEASESNTSSSHSVEATISESEEHDNTDVHATITGALDMGETGSSTGTLVDDFLSDIPLSSSTVMESISDIASTTVNGFLGLDFVSGSSSATTSGETENASSTSGTGSGSGNPPASCPASSGPSTSTSTTPQISNPTIRSGSATVLANVLNLLNTTFINSPGGILFSNFTDTAPTIDLRDASLLTSCDESICNGQEGLEVNIVGDATIDNDLILDASSGRNLVSEGGAATSSIETGDAIAGLNLVNIANTTFINSQYLIVTLNAFSGVNGDIVFPSLLNFFASGGDSSLASGSTISNAATVHNDVAAAADSGSNTTDGSDMSVISTGTADAHTNVFNQINSILPDSQISILFRISGTWNGQIFGMPSNVSQVRGPDGSVYIFGNPEEQGHIDTPTPLLNSTTTAEINNNVLLDALSGQNAIENASTSVISTGNAIASANIVNIANQNVIGRNWILAIIDIFGDFTGNIAFGRPDLWVGDQVEAPGFVQNGSTLTYKITVINNGDSPANNVIVRESPALSHLDILGMSLPQDPCVTDGIAWNLGTLLPGNAVEITYTAKVKNTSPGDRITNSTTAAATETDNNTEDNTDGTTVTATVVVSGGGGGGGSCCTNAGSASSGGGIISTSTLMVERLTANMTLEGTTTASQRIVVKNTSNSPINNVVFHDYLRDPTTHLVHEERWNLDTIAAHEEVTIQYSIVFEPGAMSGTYRLSTVLEGKNYPTTIAGNGTIVLKATPQLLAVSATEIPSVRVINRGAVQDGPILVKATSTLPKIPQTAAVAAADSGISMKFVYLILFLLLFAASYGALRVLNPEKESGR